MSSEALQNPYIVCVYYVYTVYIYWKEHILNFDCKKYSEIELPPVCSVQCAVCSVQCAVCTSISQYVNICHLHILAETLPTCMWCKSNVLYIVEILHDLIVLIMYIGV